MTAVSQKQPSIATKPDSIPSTPNINPTHIAKKPRQTSSPPTHESEFDVLLARCTEKERPRALALKSQYAKLVADEAVFQSEYMRVWVSGIWIYAPSHAQTLLLSVHRDPRRSSCSNPCALRIRRKVSIYIGTTDTDGPRRGGERDILERDGTNKCNVPIGRGFFKKSTLAIVG